MIKPYILVNERDEWRKPVYAVAEETHDLGRDKGRREVRWIVDGPDQFSVLRRLSEGTVCVECMETMPARPGPGTVSRFREVYGDKPEPTKSTWLPRVMSGCCPVCGSEVSTEMFEAMYRGVLPPIGDE